MRNVNQNTFVKEQPQLTLDRYNVAFLIMDGVFNTELTAPFDIFQHTIYREGIKSMNTFTVANSLKPVRTFEGLYVLPDDVMIQWIQKIDREAMYVTSHCDGAFVLAKAGILDQVASTTFPSDIPKYKTMFPHLDVKSDVLFVHDGKYITSAGGAKSFEAALYLCEVLYGKEIAKRLAGGLVIDWDVDAFEKYIVE